MVIAMCLCGLMVVISGTAPSNAEEKSSNPYYMQSGGYYGTGVSGISKHSASASTSCNYNINTRVESNYSYTKDYLTSDSITIHSFGYDQGAGYASVSFYNNSGDKSINISSTHRIWQDDAHSASGATSIDY